MKHDTSSAVAEAALWMNGWGTRVDPLYVGFALESKDLTASYVVKNAPAGICQR